MINPRHKCMYMRIAEAVALTSRAERLKVGCIIVKDNNIIAVGFNGTAKGENNCCEDRVNGQLVTKRGVLHAESNAIAKLAMGTVSGKDADMYITHAPCFECAKLIIQVGIRGVIFRSFYRDRDGYELLNKQKHMHIEPEMTGHLL